ncbi:MAG: helix-turn-helix transcriptional regulator [Lachnospiraceae bacterium]|nr:helix-turn-helix transcriptional regulator [Lachnospiraceae bacterium]
MAMEKQLWEKLFLAREMQNYHAPYEREYSYYDAVQKGDIKALRERFLVRPIYEKEGLGILSENQVRNVLYHIIISIAMVSRYCIEGGLDAETAYSLSDLYIQRADLCRSREELGNLHREMTLDFASRMRKLQKEKIYSKHVVVCIEYIYEHLHEKICIRDLAKETKLHENYLSHLFKQEMGVTIVQYIQDKKLEQAEYMLKHTDTSILEIANDLNFSSQSYFIQVFKKKNGKTPKEFRNHYFRQNLKNDMKSSQK